jgi:hypothetical protein
MGQPLRIAGRSRGTSFALVAFVALAACDRAGGPGATFQDGVERQPGPGQVVLVGDPPQADQPLTIEFVDADGNAYDERQVEIKTGDTIEASTFGPPGEHVVRINGVVCDGTFELLEDQTTTVTVSFPANCSITVTAVKPTT